MLSPRFKSALFVLAASAGLSACASYGSPYGGTSIGVGVGYGSPYGYGYGSPYGYGYGYGGPYGYMPAYWTGHNSYFGWYDGFYYPGAGYWLYDPYGRRFRMNDRQSRYWSDMLKKFREQNGATAQVRENFAGFRSKAKAGAAIPGVDLDAAARANERSLREVSQIRRNAQSERQVQQRQQRVERQQVRTERQQARVERAQSMREAVIERREQRRVVRGKSDD